MPSKRRRTTNTDKRLALHKRLEKIGAEVSRLRRDRAAVKREEFVEMSKALHHNGKAMGPLSPHLATRTLGQCSGCAKGANGRARPLRPERLPALAGLCCRSFGRSAGFRGPWTRIASPCDVTTTGTLPVRLGMSSLHSTTYTEA